MKKLFIIAFLLAAIQSAFAQENFLSGAPIQIGYFGHFGLHPGIKLGTEFSLRHWEKKRKKGKKTKYKAFLISPQIGFYTHPRNHSGLLLQAEFSKRTIKEESRFYYAWGAGLGYMMQINPTDTYIYSETGEIVEKSWSSRSYFMPALHIETGLKLNSKITLYDKITLGSKMKYNTGFTLEPFFELGLRIKLKP